MAEKKTPKSNEYRFIDEPLPERTGRPKTTVYADIVRDFVASERETAKVELDGRTASTLYQQLLRAAKTSNEKVKVHRSGEGVWLVRGE